MYITDKCRGNKVSKDSSSADSSREDGTCTDETANESASFSNGPESKEEARESVESKITPKLITNENGDAHLVVRV